MADPQQVLSERVRDALVAAYGADYADADPLIRPSAFADFQSNAALPLAKRLGRAPRDIASEIAARLDVSDIAEPPTVSGPGFVNLTLRNDWIARRRPRSSRTRARACRSAARPKTVIVEYSSPNIAKEMHVGHLRSTIVGDAIARVTEFVGDHLIRDNHVGDWGTPFGMLIEHLVDVGEDSPEAGLLRTDPNAFYQHARVKFDSDPVFADRAQGAGRQAPVGHTTRRRCGSGTELVELSKAYLRDTYARLRVTLTDDDIRGESFYNDMLPGVADDLDRQGPRADQRRRAVRLPRGVHQPGRQRRCR